MEAAHMSQVVQSRHSSCRKLYRRRCSSFSVVATRPTKKPRPSILRAIWGSGRFLVRAASIRGCLHSPRQSQRLTGRLDGHHVGFVIVVRIVVAASGGAAGQTVIDRGGWIVDGGEFACGWGVDIAGDLEEVCEGSEGGREGEEGVNMGSVVK